MTQGRGALVAYSWHRAVGLAFAFPALAFVIAGILTAFADPLEAAFGPFAPEPVLAESSTPVPRAVPPARAIHIALDRYPGARLSILNLPDAGTPWYRVRVLQPGERRRVFGTTTVFIHKTTGELLADYDALHEPTRIRLLNAFYALHTGEWYGPAGRLVSLATGVWLAAMIGLGGTLWWLRRRARQANARSGTSIAAGDSATG